MSQALSKVAVIIGGEEYQKPFDANCAACRSPWLNDIDSMLASGKPYGSIRNFLKVRKGGNITPTILMSHIEHLAPPHRTMRGELESSARERGADVEGTRSFATAKEILQSVMDRGYESLAAGQLSMTTRDLVEALRMHRQIQSEENATVSAEAWQEAFTAMIEIIRRYLDEAQWKSFVQEVYQDEAVIAIYNYGSRTPDAIAQGPVST